MSETLEEAKMGLVNVVIHQQPCPGQKHVGMAAQWNFLVKDVQAGFLELFGHLQLNQDGSEEGQAMLVLIVDADVYPSVGDDGAHQGLPEVVLDAGRDEKYGPTKHIANGVQLSFAHVLL